MQFFQYVDYFLSEQGLYFITWVTIRSTPYFFKEAMKIAIDYFEKSQEKSMKTLALCELFIQSQEKHLLPSSGKWERIMFPTLEDSGESEGFKIFKLTYPDAFVLGLTLPRLSQAFDTGNLLRLDIEFTLKFCDHHSKP